MIPDRLPGLDEALRTGVSLPRFTKPVPELIDQYVQAFEKVWRTAINWPKPKSFPSLLGAD